MNNNLNLAVLCMFTYMLGSLYALQIREVNANDSGEY